MNRTIRRDDYIHLTLQELRQMLFERGIPTGIGLSRDHLIDMLVDYEYAKYQQTHTPAGPFQVTQKVAKLIIPKPTNIVMAQPPIFKPILPQTTFANPTFMPPRAQPTFINPGLPTRPQPTFANPTFMPPRAEPTFINPGPTLDQPTFANPTRGDLNRIFIPVSPTRAQTIFNAAVIPITQPRSEIVGTRPLSPTIHTAPSLNSLRNKLSTAQYEPYDYIWITQRVILPVITTGGEFVQIFNKYQIISINGNSVLVIAYLMNEVNVDFIIDLMSALSFTSLTATIDVYYNLLWYLNISEEPYMMNLTNAEKVFISKLTIEQLLYILGDKYIGPIDHASLLFAAVSGKSTHRPEIRDIPRYNEIMNLPPATVWSLADLYRVVNIEQRLYSWYPPYVHLALQPESTIEKIALTITDENIDAIIGQYGYIPPNGNFKISARNKRRLFLKELKHYDPIFNRGPIEPPPMLKGKTDEQIEKILEPYTLKELIDAYEPTEPWMDRADLIETCIREGRGGSKWAWRHRHCNNDDTFNVEQGEAHGDIDKDLLQDPTLSYGIPGNYRCYQVAELEGAWTLYDDVFHFRVPDWVNPNQALGMSIIRDPVTGEPLARDFPIGSIHQLKQLLLNAPQGYKVKRLVEKVDQGLRLASESVIVLRNLTIQYNTMPPDYQYLVKLYLAWMFMYGMWMRFWSGPGYSWPLTWIEGGGKEERCEPGRRDEHIFIQHSVRTAIMDTYEKFPDLKQFIEDLPLIDYNFRTGEASVATEGANTIKEIIDRLTIGDFCMGHGSDLMLKTAYCLIINLFNVKENNTFNQFLNEMTPDILAVEKQVVDYQLSHIKNPNLDDNVRRKVDALKARKAELDKPIPKQPQFTPLGVNRSDHTDPGLGYRLRFGI